jgi:quercetin dioxygenase-like cupin family protein
MFAVAVEALSKWNLGDVTPDTTIHRGVEVREVQMDPRGAHLTHVRIYGERGARIVSTVHDDEHETIVVLRGLVTADINGVKHPGMPGTIFNIPRGAVHGYTPMLQSGPLATVELLAIYQPAP